MTTFNLLVNKITNINTNIFSPEYNNIYFVDNFFLNNFLLELKHKNKFMFFKELANNFYYKNNLLNQNNLMFLFNKIQKI